MHKPYKYPIKLWHQVSNKQIPGFDMRCTVDHAAIHDRALTDNKSIQGDQQLEFVSIIFGDNIRRPL